MTESRTYRIGEVAAATGVTVATLRFYEREGLLPAPIRSLRGARRFPPGIVGRVQFIKRAQVVGLTLRDIEILVKSRPGASRTSCRQIRSVLATRLRDLDRRLEEMQAFRELLAEHLAGCDRALAAGTARDCPTLDALERTSAADLRRSQ
jgi:DNA-binding transcriptional MerR regulator